MPQGTKRMTLYSTSRGSAELRGHLLFSFFPSSSHNLCESTSYLLVSFARHSQSTFGTKATEQLRYTLLGDHTLVEGFSNLLRHSVDVCSPRTKAYSARLDKKFSVKHFFMKTFLNFYGSKYYKTIAYAHWEQELTSLWLQW